MTSRREFQKSKQNKTATKAIEENDIVIIYDEKVSHHLWRLGRVVDIISSRDSNIRAVGKTGVIIKRPVNKLYPSECLMMYGKEEEVNTVNQEDKPGEKRDAAIMGEF